MDRRQFLKTAGAVGAAALPHGSAAVAAGKPQKFKIGMAATVWLQGNASTETYWKACQDIGTLGFKGTEADDTLSDLDVAYGDRIAEFKKTSAKHGVDLKGVFYSFALWDPQQMPEERKKAAHIAKFLKDIGGGYIATGEGRRQRRGQTVLFDRQPEQAATQQSAEGVERAIKGLNELGKLCKEEYGITIAFHPGRGMNKSMIQKILDSTDPRSVGFCADVGHLAGAGYNPVEAVKAYGSRLAASHWKDFDPNTPFRRADYAHEIKGDFVELGRGIVDLPALAEVFKDLGYSGWVMLELDRPAPQKTPLESAREMKAYVAEKLKLTI